MLNQIHRVIGAGIWGCGLMFGIIQGSAAPIDFDISRDFSTNSNPGGVWSYGWKSTVGGPMTLFNFSGYGQGENGVRVFYWSKNSFEPANVYFNQTSQTTTSDGGTAVYPPGTVWFFPGIEGHIDNFGVIRFTAPTAGVYRLETSASTYIVGPTSGDSDFHVVTNGTELFGHFLPGNGTATYSNTVELAAGGIIDFLVGRGQDDRVWRSGLKIRARLSLISSEPEPPLQSLVVPLEKTNVAGEGAGGTLNTRLRSQQVYGASQFPGPVVIRELRFRPWVGRGAFSVNISNIQINLSSTAAQPDGLSATYSANVGPNDTVVYSGPLSISSAATGPAEGPKDFDIIIPLQQPFPYDPDRGNLLVDVRNFSGAPIGNIVDHTGSSTDRASRAFSLDPNGTTATTVNTGADIIQIVYTPGVAAATYDLSRDFSTNSNPNGVWSYGWQESLGGVLTLFNYPGTSHGENGVPVVYWSKNSFEPSNVYFNPSSQTTTSDGGEAVYPPGTVWFFPGVEGHADNFGVIRFTVPAGGSGTYRVETSVRSYLDGNRSGDTDFHVLRNGTELFARFLAPRSNAGYSNTITVAAGDTFDFAIGRGEDGSELGSGLKIEARLTLVTTNLPPPPGTNCLTPPSGLVSWWPAEGVATDVADGNDGVLLNGVTYGPGLVGGRAFQFDGGSGKIDLGDPANLRFAEAFTIEAWILATGLPRGPHGQIFFRGDMRGCVDPYYLAMQPNGAIRLHIEDETGTTICGENVETEPLPLNEWKHVAGVFDSGLMRIYVDGVLAAEANTSLRPFAELSGAGAGVAIGNHSGGFNDQGFNGLIDELAVYGRALSASEIRAIFSSSSAGKCRPPEPPPAERAFVVGTPPDAQEGEMVSVPLRLISNGEVGGFSVVLRYDQDYLSAMDVTWGSALENAFKQADVSRLGRLGLVVATSGEAIPSGTQVVATVNFRARTTPADATSQLRLQIEDVSNPAGEVLETPTDVQNGRVTVLGGNSTDNNGNNRIDVGDGTLLMRMLGGLDSVRRWDLERNDFNDNGMLDSGDVIKIFRIAAGLDPQPAGGGGGGELVLAADAAGGEAAVLSPARLSGTPGQLVRLQVRLQNIESWIAGASFTVNYPTGALRLAASQPYRVGSVPGNALAIWNASQNGQLKLAVGRDMPWPVDAGGVLAELTFQVLPGASQQHLWQVGLTQVEITPDGYAPRAVASSGTELVGRAAVGGSLSAPRIGSAGEFTFTANGDAGATYELQASTDLVDWQTLTTFVNATGSVQVSDPDAVNHSRRFYRLVPVR